MRRDPFRRARVQELEDGGRDRFRHEVEEPLGRDDAAAAVAAHVEHEPVGRRLREQLRGVPQERRHAVDAEAEYTHVPVPPRAVAQLAIAERVGIGEPRGLLAVGREQRALDTPDPLVLLVEAGRHGAARRALGGPALRPQRDAPRERDPRRTALVGEVDRDPILVGTRALAEPAEREGIDSAGEPRPRVAARPSPGVELDDALDRHAVPVRHRDTRVEPRGARRVMHLGHDELDVVADVAPLHHERQEGDPTAERPRQHVARVQVAQRVEDRQHLVVELTLVDLVEAVAQPEAQGPQPFDREAGVHLLLERQMHVAAVEHGDGLVDDRQLLLGRQRIAAERPALEVAQADDGPERTKVPSVRVMTCVAPRRVHLRGMIPK